jgi:excisionase family DNA binding protein
MTSSPMVTGHAVTRAATGEKESHCSGAPEMDAQGRITNRTDVFEKLIDSVEAARLLGDIHVKTLQRYARRGELPGYRVGGHWYFRASELDAWLRSRINS